MRKFFIISWCIFQFDILVCLGLKKEEVLNKLKKYGTVLSDEEIEALTMYGDGRTVMLKGGQTVLWLKHHPKKNISLLVHESIHATDFLLDELGIDDKNKELNAYMVEYLVREIQKKL